MRRSWIIVTTCAAVLAGCGGPPSNEIHPGDQTWASRSVDGPLVIPRGSVLHAEGELYLGGPILVQGRLDASGINIFFADRDSAMQIVVEGGTVIFQDVDVAGSIELIVDRAGTLTWNVGEVPLLDFRVANASVVTLEAMALQPLSAGSGVFSTRDSHTRIVNSTIDDARLHAQGSGNIRLVNVAALPDAFEGDGTIESARQARLRAIDPAGTPLPHVSVRASSTLGDVIGETGGDGRAYVELIEIARQGGRVEIGNPWRLSIDGRTSLGVAVVTENEQEFDVRAS